MKSKFMRVVIWGLAALACTPNVTVRAESTRLPDTYSLTAGSEPPHQYTAVLSADGAAFTQGRWGAGEPAKGTWTAQSSKDGGRS